MRTRVLAGLAALPLAAVMASCSSTPTVTAAELITKVNQATLSAGSVSYKVIATQTPKKGQAKAPVETLTAQISAPASAESIRYDHGGGNVDVIFVGGLAYVRGDHSTLYYGLGFTDEAATKYAGQWISIAPNDPPFKEISATLTITSNIQAFIPVGKSITIGNQTTINGVTGIPLSGAAPASITVKSGALRLYVDPKTYLPVAAGEVGLNSSGSRVSEVVKFYNWGKPVTVTAPTGAISYSSAVHG